MEESWRMRKGAPRRGATSSYDNVVDDFSDVFGGPPRTISFYEEIFQHPNSGFRANNKSGRSLQAFSIPAKNDVFYKDIFGNDDQQDSIRRFKGSSTSTQDLRPLRPMICEDVTLASFASKLRPINVPGRWKSCYASPEMVNPWLEESEVSSYDCGVGLDDHNDDELKSSYVSSDHYQEGNDDAIGEAVAWAKQKFGQHTPTNHFPDHVDDKSKTEAKQQSEDDRESRLLEEDGEAELWSSGT